MTMSDERRAEIDDLLKSTGWASTVTGPRRWLYEAVVDLVAENAALRADPVRQAAQAVVDARSLGLVAIVDAVEELTAALADPEAPQPDAWDCDHGGNPGPCTYCAADPEALPDPKRPEWIELTTDTNHLRRGVHRVVQWEVDGTVPVVEDADGGWNHLPRSIWKPAAAPALPDPPEPAAMAMTCGSGHHFVAPGADTCVCGSKSRPPAADVEAETAAALAEVAEIRSRIDAEKHGPPEATEATT